MPCEKIGIIGGGVSGLSVAFKLLEKGFNAEDITVFEARPTLGGNADTAQVILGTDFRGCSAQNFVRLADLGVNDINITAYKSLIAAMRKTGYCDDDCDRKNPDAPFKAEKYLGHLEDTVCYFTPGGEEIWTIDAFRTQAMGKSDHRGVVDMRFSLNADTNKKLRDAEKKFMQQAAKDFDPKENKQKAWWRYSVDAYVKHFEENILKEKNWGFSAEILHQLVRLFLKPRISAMYFADDAGAGGMPFRGVMSYYRLQEGIDGGGDPDRRYFKDGSQSWINHLAGWLEGKGVTIQKNYNACVAASGKDAVLISDVNDPEKKHKVGRVVMAAHADHQLQSFAAGPQRHLTTESLLTEKMAKNLGRVQHSNSRAVAHTFAGVLPPDRGAWRTYNVMIREGVGLKPYQMTYVQNRHRNDPESADYNASGLPIYFVTLNPQEPIPEKHVLRIPPEAAIKRWKAKPGYGDFSGPEPVDGALAVATFKHIVMNDTLLDIQKELPFHQGMANGRVFFAGCWTKGAGLHEECFQQAEAVVEAMQS